MDNRSRASSTSSTKSYDSVTSSAPSLEEQRKRSQESAFAEKLRTQKMADTPLNVGSTDDEFKGMSMKERAERLRKTLKGEKGGKKRHHRKTKRHAKKKSHRRRR